MLSIGGSEDLGKGDANPSRDLEARGQTAGCAGVEEAFVFVLGILCGGLDDKVDRAAVA